MRMDLDGTAAGAEIYEDTIFWRVMKTWDLWDDIDIIFDKPEFCVYQWALFFH